jgi:hypothetical protein
MRIFILFLFFVSPVGISHAESLISAAELGEFSLQYTKVNQRQGFELQSVIGKVKALPHAGLQVRAPFDPQQIEFYVGDGQWVNRGQKVALLGGSEVHHFLEQLAAQKALYAQAEARYQQNKPLFERQGISQDRWQQITSYYYATKLELGHLNHFAELIQTTDSDDHLFLLAQSDGIWRYPGDVQLDEGTLLGSITAKQQLRYQFSLPVSLVKLVSRISVGQCSLTVSHYSINASGLSASVWSEPLTPQCEGSINQRVTVSPMIASNVQLVPMTSVFMLDGATYVAKSKGDELQPIQINLVGKQGQFYAIEEQQNLADANVLTSSVSALQGVLMGLGGE